MKNFRKDLKAILFDICVLCQSKTQPCMKKRRPAPNKLAELGVYIVKTSEDFLCFVAVVRVLLVRVIGFYI